MKLPKELLWLAVAFVVFSGGMAAFRWYTRFRINQTINSIPGYTESQARPE